MRCSRCVYHYYTTPLGETSIGKRLNFSKKRMNLDKEKDDSHNMGEVRLLCTQKRQLQDAQKHGLGWRWVQGCCLLCCSAAAKSGSGAPNNCNYFDRASASPSTLLRTGSVEPLGTSISARCGLLVTTVCFSNLIFVVSVFDLFNSEWYNLLAPYDLEGEDDVRSCLAHPPI